MKKQFSNVAEAWSIYDTVVISGAAGVDSVQGWFNNFAGLGAAQTVNFFNVRNRQIGLPWNNQDTRDAMAFPIEIYGFGITFFGPTMKTLLSRGAPNSADDHTAHMWEAEIGRHASLELQVQQDIKVETNCFIAPGGYGPVGGAYGRGDMQTTFAAANPTLSLGVTTQSSAILNNRWKFPKPIQVPRRANLSATVRFSEYASQLLQTMPGPWDSIFMRVGGGAIDSDWAMFGIRVQLTGKRLVQQRGQYHA